MHTHQRPPFETWVVQSKLRAFAFLWGLGLAISAALIGSVMALATIVVPSNAISRH